MEVNGDNIVGGWGWMDNVYRRLGVGESGWIYTLSEWGWVHIFYEWIETGSSEYWCSLILV